MSSAAAHLPDGDALHRLVRRLYPICRSITGPGVRETLTLLRESHFGDQGLPIETMKVASGTEVYDWTVPDEWRIRDAWIKDPSGAKVVDFTEHNLHVLNYSEGVHGTFALDDLKRHIHTLPEQPDLIPYRTSYYSRTWGFCMAHRDLMALEEGLYEVFIDAEHIAGSLDYGELVLPGESSEEVLISTHVCHPSMCNDNLSGIVLSRALAGYLAPRPRRYTYRFVFIPGTIGSIVWLSKNPDAARSVSHGLVLAGLGDPGAPHYKRSRRGTAPIDRAVEHLLAARSEPFGLEDFSPYGYDERQYCSPGFDLPVGCLSRTPHGQYPEYHTSGDDLDFVTGESLRNSLELLADVVNVLESDLTYRNLLPHCEPQLGKRGLYDNVGGRRVNHDDRMAILWVLNQSDGKSSLLDIAIRSGLPFATLQWAAEALLEAELLEVLP